MSTYIVSCIMFYVSCIMYHVSCELPVLLYIRKDRIRQIGIGEALRAYLPRRG